MWSDVTGRPQQAAACRDPVSITLRVLYPSLGFAEAPPTASLYPREFTMSSSRDPLDVPFLVFVTIVSLAVVGLCFVIFPR
jgi:hypothetical protein